FLGVQYGGCFPSLLIAFLFLKFKRTFGIVVQHNVSIELFSGFAFHSFEQRSFAVIDEARYIGYTDLHSTHIPKLYPITFIIGTFDILVTDNEPVSFTFGTIKFRQIFIGN